MILKNSIHKYLRVLFILFFVSVLISMLPPVLTAQVFIPTQIMSGQVISITEGNTIEMDDGFLYYPAKKNMIISIKPDEYISIKYYIDGNDERRYMEYAPGKNSLKKTPVPRANNKSHKRL